MLWQNKRQRRHTVRQAHMKWEQQQAAATHALGPKPWFAPSSASHAQATAHTSYVCSNTHRIPTSVLQLKQNGSRFVNPPNTAEPIRPRHGRGHGRRRVGRDRRHGAHVRAHRARGCHLAAGQGCVMPQHSCGQRNRRHVAHLCHLPHRQAAGIRNCSTSACSVHGIAMLTARRARNRSCGSRVRVGRLRQPCEQLQAPQRPAVTPTRTVINAMAATTELAMLCRQRGKRIDVAGAQSSAAEAVQLQPRRHVRKCIVTDAFPLASPQPVVHGLHTVALPRGHGHGCAAYGGHPAACSRSSAARAQVRPTRHGGGYGVERQPVIEQAGRGRCGPARRGRRVQRARATTNGTAPTKSDSAAVTERGPANSAARG